MTFPAYEYEKHGLFLFQEPGRGRGRMRRKRKGLMQIGRWTVRRFRACPALRALFWVSQTVLSLMPEISLAREGSEGGGGGGGELLKQTGEATDPRLHTPQRA